MNFLQKAFLFVMFTYIFFLGACSGGGGSNYKNSLTFGTGIGGNGFALVGESTTFSVGLMGSTGQIYFKLESADDMAGRAVRLYISHGTYDQKDYPNPQSYGHILLSSFRITDVGTFPVEGVLVEQVGPDMGKETSVAQSTIVMQP
jgi:hypothetical protein